MGLFELIIIDSSRFQLVKSNSDISMAKVPVKVIELGIPHGLCSRPLLFIMYVNEFEQYVQKLSLNICIDDTSVISAKSYFMELPSDRCWSHQCLEVDRPRYNLNVRKLIL